MAGHSKWAQIKRQKGVADAKRGAVFGKLANAITIAARGGSDPETNFQLRIAIEKARAANMPNENIKRAIERASGTGGGAALEEIVFEAYGPGGVAFLIEAATDNRNRTTANIRRVLNDAGARFADSGSVSYLFEKKGLITVAVNDDAQTAELAAIDAGAEDVTENAGQVFVYTKPQELEPIRQELSNKFTISEFTLVWEPKTTVVVSDPKTAAQLIKLSETIDELDDVVRVSSNFDLPENLVE